MRCSHSSGQKTTGGGALISSIYLGCSSKKYFLSLLVKLMMGQKKKKQQEEVLLFLPFILAVLPKIIFCLSCWNWWWDDDMLLTWQLPFCISGILFFWLGFGGFSAFSLRFVKLFIISYEYHLNQLVSFSLFACLVNKSQETFLKIVYLLKKMSHGFHFYLDRRKHFMINEEET